MIIPELGLTITDGGSALTLNGTVVSDAGEGTGVVVGTSTVEFTTPTAGGNASSNGQLPTGGSRRGGEVGAALGLFMLLGSLVLVM